MSSAAFESVLAEIQERVKARRVAGEYPVGLEAQLEAEFVAILQAVHRSEVNTEELSRRVGDLAHAVEAGTGPDLGSRLPGGEALHGAASRVVRRHTEPLAGALRAIGRDVHAALDEVVRVLDAQRRADERQLNEVVGAVFDRLAVLDAVVSAVADLERRIDEIERVTFRP